MAIDIGVGIGDGSSFCPVQNEPSLPLYHGYYWFLHPLFQDLAKATGQFIDQYGDASFSEDNLALLAAMLKRAMKLIESQPTAWIVAMHWELDPYEQDMHSRPHLKETFATVEKARFVALLRQWERVVARAKELDRPVVCFGD